MRRLIVAFSAVLLPLGAWLGAGEVPLALSAETGCPAAFAAATRLVLVTTKTMNDARATLETFERDAPLAPWERRSAPEPAVVGKAGLGWGLTFRHLAKPGEPLKREGDRRGLVIDYPTSREQQAGSCIFIHVWQGQGMGTVGCVAVPESTVASLQDWAGAGDAAIAILPSTARELFGACLPPGQALD